MTTWERSIHGTFNHRRHFTSSPQTCCFVRSSFMHTREEGEDPVEELASDRSLLLSDWSEDVIDFEGGLGFA